MNWKARDFSPGCMGKKRNDSALTSMLFQRERKKNTGK
jgi:hypothetical protein